ncbi:MAG: hypothetical protein ACM3VZ_11400 [Acidobacteriota bacterium]
MSINLKQNADGSAGLQGSDLDDGGFVVLTFPYNATGNASILTLGDAIMARRMVVKSIQGVPNATTTNAVTITVYKAPSGTAIASGTALHSGTYNCQGTANTNQTLSLSATSGVVDVAAGNRIGAVISGAPGAAGAGCITVTLAPA